MGGRYGRSAVVDLAAFVVLWSLGWLLLWRVPVPEASPEHQKRTRQAVTVVVPARDEEEALPVLLASLAPELGAADEVVVVDDHSTDDTAGVAARAGATVLAAPPLPAGWAGKQWACHTGAGVARGPVLVFLDADTRVESGGLGRIAALGGRPGLTSVQPYHLVPTWQERLAALFNVVGMMGTGAATPFTDLVRPRGAFGPCLATTVADYRAAGGHAVARASVLDDVALSEAYRAAGLPVRVLGGQGTITFRMYPGGIGDLVAGFTKNLASAAVAVRPMLAVAVAGWLAGCVAPLVLAGRLPGVVAGACYLAVALQLWIHLRRLGTFGPVVALLYPVALVLFLAVFTRSVLATFVLGRVRWKGRVVSTR